MACSIYQKIDADSCGGDDVMADYAAFVRVELARLYPEATITIETTTRESGVMPLMITDASWQEEEEIRAEISHLWERFGSL